ncbi:hypothetical protein [Vibrio splendidus]|uniref:hypothetical protein n=1 Tax=Vibrio splendidus TaxID=29497 RepID=UPI000D353D8D|nr:hypothetical protein [Vibrio splendidus]PTO72559.1 hypothetical protein CWN81_12950 [Vibrio splendidus]
MANISQARGALLEEAILFLLEKVGYETIDQHSSLLDDSLRVGSSGLDVRGRGAWHQIDALASFRSSPAFMYPLRLMVEAKCYQASRPVGIEVARNSVGVLKDISENYFTMHSRGGISSQAPRFNYHAAIFSTSGYTSGAIAYAVAHQIFLIQYENVQVIQPLINAIMDFDEDCITNYGKGALSEVREIYRSALHDRAYPLTTPRSVTEVGRELIESSIIEAVRNIRGSYFGMLQGRWPLHLLTENELPASAFLTDIVRCRITGYESGNWKFTPLNVSENSDNWFELQFSLPEDIAKMVRDNFGDREAVANIKQQHFSYIDLSGVIGGIRRNIRLELDQHWIARYISSLNEVRN